MRIIFIVGSPQSLTAAGVRIRYKRLQPFFHDKQLSTSIIPIKDISERDIQESDVVIISKVFSSDSLYIIALCRSLGVKVGIDLFDDYFSDHRLSVFRKLRDWLELASKAADFLICSTKRMKHVASQFIQPELVHIINDTKDPKVTFSETKTLLDQKSNYISHYKSLNILWFGIGDNPYFNVGINDLSSYSNALFRINKLTSSINFTILTNERALSSTNLAKISRLPIKPKLETWSDFKEIEYLKNTHLAFMPVSHQNFSIAKSANRCLTALTYGCQVLSNGYGLYSDFSDLIYSSTREFATDYTNSSFKFSQDTLPVFKNICKNTYDCEEEVTKFAQFLESKIFLRSSVNPINFCLVRTKPGTSKLSFKPTSALYPFIDGYTLSITATTNFGIEKYGDAIYFVFANGAENFLLKRWLIYLEQKKIDLTKSYRILNINFVEAVCPETRADLQKVVSARYAKKNPDKVLGMIQRETYQSIAASSLRNLVRVLFRCRNVFYSDCHNRIQPFKARI